MIHVDLPTIPADARRDDADTHAGVGTRPAHGVRQAAGSVLSGPGHFADGELTQKQRMADYERLGRRQ
ncbi:MAG: hypothetical protein R3E56_16650 [Burkholderiaceae bacterium]